MEKRPDIPLYTLFKANGVPQIEKAVLRCKRLCRRYNRIRPGRKKKQQKALAALFGKVGADAAVTPPFWCDYGYNIFIGNSFYSNHGLIVTDGAKVTIGDNVFIAPNCCITTAEHAIDPEQRKEGMEIAMPVTIGNNVWLGANVTVLAGATIGDNTVIGAGSVVTGPIPPNTVAAGVPCRVLRQITEEDKRRYPVRTQPESPV